MKSRHIFQRKSNSDLPIVVGGEGCYLIDKDGKRYLDGSSGAAVSCLGHSDEHVKKEISKQVETITFAHSSFFTNEPAEKLAERLASYAPKDLNRVYLVSGGSEAMEASIKLARQYF